MNRRTVICSYDVYAEVKRRLPNRPIEPSSMAPHGSLYWFGRDGAVRMLFRDKPGIWVCDHDRGFPYIKVKRSTSSVNF